MKPETQEELFNLLYKLEDFFKYDETNFGKEVGLLINKLQKELLNSKMEYGGFTSIDSATNNLQIKNDYFKKK